MFSAGLYIPFDDNLGDLLPLLLNTWLYMQLYTKYYTRIYQYGLSILHFIIINAYLENDLKKVGQVFQPILPILNHHLFNILRHLMEH